MPQKFTGQLKAQGFSEFETIPIDQLDLTSPTLQKGRWSGSAGFSGRRPLVRGARRGHAIALVQKVAAAKGGVSRHYVRANSIDGAGRRHDLRRRGAT